MPEIGDKVWIVTNKGIMEGDTVGFSPLQVTITNLWEKVRNARLYKVEEGGVDRGRRRDGGIYDTEKAAIQFAVVQEEGTIAYLKRELQAHRAWKAELERRSLE